MRTAIWGDCILLRSAASLFDDDDALGTCVRTAPCKLFLARRHIDLFNRDVAVLIEREQLFSHRGTARVADASRLIDSDFHPVLLMQGTGTVCSQIQYLPGKCAL